jgi:hypothetical protein
MWGALSLVSQVSNFPSSCFEHRTSAYFLPGRQGYKRCTNGVHQAYMRGTNEIQMGYILGDGGRKQGKWLCRSKEPEVDVTVTCGLLIERHALRAFSQKSRFAYLKQKSSCGFLIGRRRLELFSQKNRFVYLNPYSALIKSSCCPHLFAPIPYE